MRRDVKRLLARFDAFKERGKFFFGNVTPGKCKDERFNLSRHACFLRREFFFFNFPEPPLGMTVSTVNFS